MADPDDRPATHRFLRGRDAVAAFFREQGDRVHHTSGGLHVSRTEGGADRLVYLEWNTSQGVLRFLTVAPMPKIPPDCHARILAAVSDLQAELALGGVMLFRDRVSVRTYVFLNHDGSVSARVVESGMRLAIETGNRARDRLLPLLDPDGCAS